MPPLRVYEVRIGEANHGKPAQMSQAPARGKLCRAIDHQRIDSFKETAKFFW